MEVYEGQKVEISRVSLKHPLIDELPDMDVKCWPSMQTAVLRARGGRFLTCPVHYRYSKIAETAGVPFPLLSVVGVSEFEGQILFGIRSEKVRFPGKIGGAPAGHVDYGLSPEEAIAMELEEELGVGGTFRMMGVQASPLYFSVIFRVKLESDELRPSWEWSNIMWVQKEDLAEFLMKEKELFTPAFAAPFVLFLPERERKTVLEETGWRLSFRKLEELDFSIRRSQRTFSEWSRGQRQARAGR